MLNKFIKPLLFNQNRMFQYKKYQTFTSLSREVLKVKMDLYEDKDRVKQFIINQNQTVQEIESLLKEDNPNIKTIKFMIGDNIEVTDQEKLSFLNLSLNNHLKIIIDNKNTSFTFGQQLNTANYFEETKLEGELAQHEVPFQDALVIQAFIKNYKEVLEKQYPRSQVYSEKQLNDGLNKAVENFTQYNYTNTLTKNNDTIQQLRVQYEKEKEQIESIEEEAKNKSTGVIKKLIGLQCIQFAGLFYLTYGLYGWDFTEPVSYLLALSTEAVILYYFIKHRKGLNSSLIYGNKYTPLRNQLLSEKYTNSDKSLSFLKDKLDMTESKIAFGRSSEKQ